MIALALLLPQIDASYETLATALIGISTLAVAWRQHATAKEQIRLALFDKRHKVYFAAKKFAAKIIQTDLVTTEELLEYWRDTSDSKFLFPEDIQDLLRRISSAAVDKRRCNLKWEHARNASNPQEIIDGLFDQEEIATKEIEEILRVLEEFFMAYLDFREFRANPTRKIAEKSRGRESR